MSVICLALFVFQTLNWMTMTLQRQLGYMNPDGSFSMFRDYRRHTPSIWLTAFVLETLSNANEADWILQFYVSSDLLNKISLFLTSQQLPNGVCARLMFDVQVRVHVHLHVHVHCTCRRTLLVHVLCVHVVGYNSPSAFIYCV